MFIFAAALSGCGSFWRGTAAGGIGGAAGAGATYEVRIKQQLEALDEDLNAGRITQEEYDIRKDQLEKISVVY